MIDQATWNEFQTAFIVHDFVVQTLIWTGFTAILVAVITWALCALKPILFMELVRVRFGFYQGISGRVVDSRLRLLYCLDSKGRKFWIWRWQLKLTRTRFSAKLRSRLLDKMG